ncbi:S1C family serine protease [Weissella confusa]|uniref:S1C family serine protease n=1 Tax=Weissella confusa TaxID=1583 RepID=UPI00107FAFF6|nr:trypsin-like peptidase domain-containing protein [Weissella confusa]TGE53718.1 serine protease [Weissella confusa]
MTENEKRSGSKSATMKVAIVGLVAGLVGGGAAAGGVAYLNNSGMLAPSAVTTGKTTPVKVSNSNVKGTSDATKAFNKVSGAVVSVINLQKQQSLGDSMFGGLTSDYGNSSSKNSDSSDLQTASEGSGVIYKKQGGTAYIVTNNHVVAGSNALQVLLSDGTKLTATLVGTDEQTDLAVLKIDSAKVSEVADFADSSKIEPGQAVLAIGSPLGSEYATSVTEGIISATKREVDATDESGNSLGKAAVIQTDAAINPGNSGGPLVNLAGQVVGINSMKLASSSDGTSVEGMGFSIPSDTVVSIINELEKNGKVERPALGVTMVDLSNVSTSDQSSVLKLPTSVSGGVVVMGTTDGSAAAEAGLKKYDVITKIDDTEIAGSGDLRDALYKHKVGDTIKISYYRDGKEKTVDAKLTKTTSSLTSSSESN